MALRHAFAGALSFISAPTTKSFFPATIAAYFGRFL
jgi:hypothetical protein